MPETRGAKHPLLEGKRILTFLDLDEIGLSHIHNNRFKTKPCSDCLITHPGG